MLLSPITDNAETFDVYKGFKFENPLVPRPRNLSGYKIQNAFANLGTEFVNAKVGERLVLYFSDNLYVAERTEDALWWLSLDGSKMESSHLLSDIQHTAKFLAELWGTEHDPVTLKLLTEMIPQLSASPDAFLDGMLFKFPGMISGIFGTSTYNGMKMAHIAATICDWLNGVNLDKYSFYATFAAEQVRLKRIKA